MARRGGHSGVRTRQVVIYADRPGYVTRGRDDHAAICFHKAYFFESASKDGKVVQGGTVYEPKDGITVGIFD